MNSGRHAVDGHNGQEGKIVGNLCCSSKLEKPNIGHGQKCSKRHLYIDLNGPAQHEEHESEHEPEHKPEHEPEHKHEHEPEQEPDTPADNFLAPCPIVELPGRNLEEAFDGPIDWASLNIGLDGRISFYKPQPMTEAERNESEWRLALNSAVYEAQERDEAYYQGRLANLGFECGLPLENQNLDLDTNFEGKP